MANYQLDFPAVDPYGNDNAFFADVPATQQFFTWIQIAKNAGIAAASSTTAGNCTAPPAGSNPPITPPPGPGGTGGSSQVCSNFGPAALVTRAEMARWVVLAQMTEAQVTAYLNATGGDPSVVGPTASSFADDLAGLPTVPGTATTNCTSALISNSASLCFGQPSGSVGEPLADPVYRGNVSARLHQGLRVYQRWAAHVLPLGQSHPRSDVGVPDSREDEQRLPDHSVWRTIERSVRRQLWFIPAEHPVLHG